VSRSRQPAPGVRRKCGPRGRPFERGNRIGASTRFHKGESGNPAGGPKYAEISKALRAYLALGLGTALVPRTHAEKVAYKWLRLAEKGNLGAMRESANRTEGLPRVTAETIGHDPLAELIESMKQISRSLPPPEDPPVDV
jgi:Family of unknown function (DUF5681)